MYIECIASSSKGNCFQVSDGKTRLLLECGLPIKKIQSAIGFTLSSIEGCLITHEHMDHAKSVLDLALYGINCYMSAGTKKALNLSGFRYKEVKTGQAFKVGTFTVKAFNVNHDAAEPFGYALFSNVTKEKLLFITDSYYVEQRFGCFDYILIECNYIAENLKHHEINIGAKKRILHSHMSLETCIKFLEQQDLSKTKQIFLMHISADRGNAEEMQNAVQRATGKQVTVFK